MKWINRSLGVCVFVALAIVIVYSSSLAHQSDNMQDHSDKVIGQTDHEASQSEASQSKEPVTPVTVEVTLNSFSIDSAVTTFKKGVPYRLVITNKSRINHEMMIMPVNDKTKSTEMSMEEMDEMALGMVEEEDMPPGATQTIDITFTKAYPKGTLEFSCHIPGHYEAGMYLPIVVK